MTRASITAVLLLCATYAAPRRLMAQTQALPSYDVTTIKPHKPGDSSSMWRWRANTFEATNSSLPSLIASVYGVRYWLVFGVPPWAQSARWDIQAKISDADPAAMDTLTPEQHRQMILGILKERFGLQSHLETKEQPVYDLTVLSEGPKFHPSAPPPVPADGSAPAKPQMHWTIRNGELTASVIPMATVAENLSYQFERMVVDKTGLMGNYDLKLRWTPDDKVGKATDNGLADQPPDIFTALKQQLGLKLTLTKASVPIVVIDHIQQPDEN